MEITEIINKFLMPLVVAGCFALGSALKKAEFFQNKYIPLAMLILGAALGGILSGFTVEGIIAGAVSGWASTGFDQTIKQLTHKE